MTQLVLKTEIVDKINDDPMLFGKVAVAMGLKTRSLSNLLPSNPPRLATASVIKVLREHLNIENDSELLTEMSAA